MMNLRFRIAASGFTDEECQQYGLAAMNDELAITRFLSNKDNNAIFRPQVNRSAQLHLLEDKWATHLFLSTQAVPVVQALGVYHSKFGNLEGGAPLRSPRDLETTVKPLLPLKLVFKPRGGRQGRNIIVAEFLQDTAGHIAVRSGGRQFSVSEFIDALPKDAFGDYDGGYHGWLVQHFVNQHDFMLELAPYAVNTFRVVTFLTVAGDCKLMGAVLRLGRKGSPADNWDKGGLAVGIDASMGRLGRGVFKPAYGGQWTAHHPDSGALLEGRQIPYWNAVIDLCSKAAVCFSGVPSIGWDVVLTSDGPAILEGNATWSLPLLQIHSKGLLTDEMRKDLAAYGAHFPSSLKTGFPALASWTELNWKRSRASKALKNLRLGP
jgi:hypothetical protein